MTIGKKIIGAYAVVLTLLAIVTIGAFYSLGRIKAAYDRFLDVNQRLVEAASEIRWQLRTLAQTATNCGGTETRISADNDVLAIR